jgi:hypothetical protein
MVISEPLPGIIKSTEAIPTASTVETVPLQERLKSMQAVAEGVAHAHTRVGTALLQQQAEKREALVSLRKKGSFVSQEEAIEWRKEILGIDDVLLRVIAANGDLKAAEDSKIAIDSSTEYTGLQPELPVEEMMNNIRVAGEGIRSYHSSVTAAVTRDFTPTGILGQETSIRVSLIPEASALIALGDELFRSIIAVGGDVRKVNFNPDFAALAEKTGVLVEDLSHKFIELLTAHKASYSEGEYYKGGYVVKTKAQYFPDGTLIQWLPTRIPGLFLLVPLRHEGTDQQVRLLGISRDRLPAVDEYLKTMRPERYPSKPEDIEEVRVIGNESSLPESKKDVPIEWLATTIQQVRQD